MINKEHNLVVNWKGVRGGKMNKQVKVKSTNKIFKMCLNLGDRSLNTSIAQSFEITFTFFFLMRLRKQKMGI